jgi:hypothetical protein
VRENTIPYLTVLFTTRAGEMLANVQANIA